MKPQLYSVILIVSVFIISTPLLSQQIGDPIYRSYSSQSYNDLLRPAIDTSERVVTAIKGKKRRGPTVSTSLQDNWNELVIPVVFHILYTGNEDKVAESQILEQIEVLNDGFGGLMVPQLDDRDPDYSFRRLATDTKIKFCLASPAPGEEIRKSINFRTISNFHSAADSYLKSSIGGAEPWDVTRYLNIWIVQLPDNVAGYAQRPGVSKESDGIVIDPRFFGVGGTALYPFDEGKTLTHLVGTYLGLGELWSEQGCGDDGIADTPIHNAPNFGMPASGHISTCDGYPFEMTMNFMDNTDDAGLYMFTHGQALRMRRVLLAGGERAELASGQVECINSFTTLKAFAGDELSIGSFNKVASGHPDEASLNVSPNPVRGETVLRVYLPEKTGEVQITFYDAKGSQISRIVATLSSTGTLTLPVSVGSWQPGLYLIKVAAGDLVLTENLIVQ